MMATFTVLVIDNDVRHIDASIGLHYDWVW